MPKVIKKPGSFNFYKELQKDAGCRTCKKNIMGICKLSNREVPMTCQNSNKVPKWCALPGKNGGYEWVH